MGLLAGLILTGLVFLTGALAGLSASATPFLLLSCERPISIFFFLLLFIGGFVNAHVSQIILVALVHLCRRLHVKKPSENDHAPHRQRDGLQEKPNKADRQKDVFSDRFHRRPLFLGICP